MIRLPHLDVLRGIAMLGILPVNIAQAAFPAGTVLAAASAAPSGTWLHAVVAVVFEGKFITIFAFLFGAGLAVQRLDHEARAEPASRETDWTARMARRLGTLFVLGAAHAILLWQGDVVATYALVGVPGAFLVRWKSVAGLVWTGGILVLTPTVLLLAVAGLSAIGDGSGPETEPLFGAADPAAPFPAFFLEAASAALGSDGAFQAAVYGSGSYAKACVLRGVTWAIYQPVILAFYGLRLLGLFALGMAWVRSGWAAGPLAHAAALRRIGWAGALVGLPLACVGRLLQTPHESAAKFSGDALNELASLGLAAAYVAAVTLVVARRTASGGPPGILSRAFEAIGRTAFSNYVLQSVVMAAVLTGIGLGLHSRLTYVEVLLWVPATWALCAAASLLWTRHLGQGPVERTWRAIAAIGRPAVQDGGETGGARKQ